MFSDPLDDALPSSDLLPLPGLTATTVLGGRSADTNTFDQLLAVQIASAVKTRNAEESRMIVFGLGLDAAPDTSAVFADLVGLSLQVL